MKTKIIFHDADLDGHTSAAILLIENSKFDEPVDLVPYDYDRDLNSRIVTGNVVYMVDVSVKIPKLLELAKDSAEFYLIDHHVSFYEDLLKYCEENNISYINEPFGPCNRITIKSFNFTYYYTDILSACELTSKLFGSNLKYQSRELISILGQYDTWRKDEVKKFIDDKDWESVVLPIQYSLRAYMNPEKLARILWSLDNKGANYSIEKLISQGKVIIDYLKTKFKDDLERYSFNFELQGLRVLAMNTNNFNSTAFEDFYNKDIHDAMLAFNFTGKEWRISLYTENKEVDILKIAKFFGGGGHQKACGFKIPHNQMVFRSGKLEFGILTVMDINMIPQSYKGVDVKDILESIKNQPLELIEEEETSIVVPQYKLEEFDFKEEDLIMEDDNKPEIKRIEKPQPKKAAPKKKAPVKKTTTKKK